MTLTRGILSLLTKTVDHFRRGLGSVAFPGNKAVDDQERAPCWKAEEGIDAKGVRDPAVAVCEEAKRKTVSGFEPLQPFRGFGADAKYLNVTLAQLKQSVTQPAGMNGADGCPRPKKEVNQHGALRVVIAEPDDGTILIDGC